MSDAPGLKFRAMLDGTLVGPELDRRIDVEEYKRFLRAAHPGAFVTHIEWRTSSLEEEVE